MRIIFFWPSTLFLLHFVLFQQVLNFRISLQVYKHVLYFLEDVMVIFLSLSLSSSPFSVLVLLCFSNVLYFPWLTSKHILLLSLFHDGSIAVSTISQRYFIASKVFELGHSTSMSQDVHWEVSQVPICVMSDGGLSTILCYFSFFSFQNKYFYEVFTAVLLSIDI